MAENTAAVEFYAQECLQKGWSRDMLLNAIKMNTYATRQPQIRTNNFNAALPAAQADYANEVFRSFYNLGFLGITEPFNKPLCYKKRFLYVGQCGLAALTRSESM